MNLLNRIASEVHLMFRRPSRMQYAALCYRMRKKDTVLDILMITSRDTGRWVIPKGWPMQGKRAHEVAEREAFEEAGVSGRVRKTPLGSYSYQKGLDHDFKIACKVQVHALAVSGLARRYPEKGQRQVEWMDHIEAARLVNEPELRDLILAFGKKKLKKSPVLAKPA